MESFFAALVSVSLVFAWTSGTKLAVATRDTCTTGAEFQTTAVHNAATYKNASISPFGRTEAGWQIYAPQIAHTIGTPCAPDTKGFAATLASWQAEHRLPATGAVNTATLSVMKSAWQRARPFIEEFQTGACPEAPAENSLTDISAREGWFGKISKLDPRALKSLREMAAAARAEDLRIAADRQLFQIVSAFRSPAYDAGRCASEHNCNGVVRARCSAHRTGRAVDLYIGALPGQSPVSSDDANRLYQTQTPAYRWLVKNAARFGFVNYVFEPWHWEWVGNPAPETTTFTAVAVKQAPRARQVSSASMTDTPPFAQLSLRLRSLFGSAD